MYCLLVKPSVDVLVIKKRTFWSLQGLLPRELTRNCIKNCKSKKTPERQNNNESKGNPNVDIDERWRSSSRGWSKGDREQPLFRQQNRVQRAKYRSRHHSAHHGRSARRNAKHTLHYQVIGRTTVFTPLKSRTPGHGIKRTTVARIHGHE